MSTAADEIEFKIKRLPRGGFKATVHTFGVGRWWLPYRKLCVSEFEAMRWINSRLVLRGFEEAYAGSSLARKPRENDSNAIAQRHVADVGGAAFGERDDLERIGPIHSMPRTARRFGP